MGRFTEWFHRMGSPPHFYTSVRTWIIALYGIGIVLLIAGTTWGLFYAPPDRYQGEVFRIMYVHVPAAHLAEALYVAAAVAGVVFVIWRMKMADVVIASVAPVGCAVTALALLTGIVWGIPTWGTGWVWDARTTSVLILLFLFMGLIVLRGAFGRPERGAFFVSMLAIIGVVNIPIIKYSVDWFSTLHQPSSISIGDPVAISTSMLWPLLLNGIGAYFFVAAAVLSSMRTEVLSREASTSWVSQRFTVES